MSKKNEWNLYDSALDKIDTKIEFENPSAQQLMDAFNETTPKLMKLCERREFLTYFFMGPNEPSLLTPKQAMDFKLTFGTNNFPANGLQTYMDWRDGGMNNYSHVFPYPRINGSTAEIRTGEWGICAIEDIPSAINEFIVNQSTYGDWFTKIVRNGVNWIDALSEPKLIDSSNFKILMAKLAGLFATGKFVVYYDLIVKEAIKMVIPNVPFEFDPYTGTITIESPTAGTIKCLFTELLNHASVPEAKMLMILNDQKSLPDIHRFFCILCQLAGNYYDKKKTKAKYNDEPITSYWDFTPIKNGTQRPYEPFYDGPDVLVKTKFMINIRQLVTMFFKQTRAINNGSTSYKDYWNGALLKLSDTETRVCPFFFVIHVDFDSTRESRNPFGDQLTDINNAINKVLVERDKLQNTLFSVFKNVTVNKSCSSSIVNASTVIFQEGSTDNQQINNATCYMDSASVVHKDGEKEDSTAKNAKADPEPIDDTVIENTFITSNQANIEGTSAGTSASTAAGAAGKEGPPGKDCSITTPGVKTFVVIICILIGLIVLWNIYTTYRLMKQQKGGSVDINNLTTA